MGSGIPKPYLPFAGRTVIEQVLDVFMADGRIAGVTVAVSAADAEWQHSLLRSQGKPVRIVRGGTERAHSVLNALHSLRDELRPGDWVLVHDAARPCLHPADMDKLAQALAGDPVGGLLATPLTDTVKRVDSDGRVLQTPERAGLWRALTPQMFRYGLLQEALESALASGYTPTDESAAIEALCPNRVSVVEGRNDNIKITKPADLALAAAILAARARSAT